MIIITTICLLSVVAIFAYRLINLYKVKLDPKDSSWKKVVQSYNATKGKFVPEKTHVEASEIINVESLYSSNNVNYSKLKSTANSLVGLGILGTFIGLSVALMANLNLSDTETTISSVHSLLDGMKTAFYTSVVGMAASLFFGYALRRRVNKIQSVISNLNNELDGCFLISSTIVMYEKNKLLADQNELLTKIGKSIGNSIEDNITKSFSDGIQRLENQLITQTLILRETTENVHNELENTSQNIREIFAEQNVIVKDMTTNLGLSVKNVMTDGLKNSFNELIDSVTNKISSELVDAADKLKECTNYLAKSAESLHSGSAVMDSSTKGLNDAANNLGIGAEIIKEYSTGVESRITQISETIDKLNQTISEIGDASNQFSAASTHAKDSVNEIIEAIHKIDMDDIHGTINEFLNSMDDFTQDVEKISEIAEMAPKAKDVIKEISNATAEYISTLHEKVRELTTSYTTSFTNACESINGTIRKLDYSMSSSRSNVESSANRIVGIIDKAAKELNEASIKLKSNETQRH